MFESVLVVLRIVYFILLNYFMVIILDDRLSLFYIRVVWGWYWGERMCLSFFLKIDFKCVIKMW